MTIKEGIIKSLEVLNKPSAYYEIYEYIIKNNLVDFSNAKTPDASVSSALSFFIRNGDNRVKRIKQNNNFLYYLSKDEVLLNFDFEKLETNSKQNNKIIKNKFEERDLHLLLSSYLKNSYTYSKTIFHEQSNRNDENRKWTHPDIIGIKFLKLKTATSQIFLKSINKLDTFKLSSYEIKKEINTDYELKKYFFQTYSNSSWANYGFLVTFEINENLYDEIERLNQSFGIGIILLKPNPYESKILFPARYKELDFITIDKLCNINRDFSSFVELIEKLMTADERYIKAIEKELEDFCDNYFKSDTEFENYSIEKNIPIDIDN